MSTLVTLRSRGRQISFPVEMWEFLERLAAEKKLPVSYIVGECVRKEYHDQIGKGVAEVVPPGEGDTEGSEGS